MTDYKLNTYIEWTKEDQARGKCPVPDGAKVTLWFDYMDPFTPRYITACDWGNCSGNIVGYLIHSVPRDPVVRWLVVGGEYNACWYRTEESARKWAVAGGGHVVKMVEEAS